MHTIGELKLQEKGILYEIDKKQSNNFLNILISAFFMYPLPLPNFILVLLTNNSL